MDQQREETTQQQSRRLKERLDEQFDIRDRALRQEFGRVHQKIDNLGKDNEARDKASRGNSAMFMRRWTQGSLELMNAFVA
jgi:hypothetical protein